MLLESLGFVSVQKQICEIVVGGQNCLKFVAEAHVGCLGDDVPDSLLALGIGNFALGYSDQNKEQSLLVCFSVHFVDNLRGELHGELELFNGLFIALLRSVNDSLVVQISNDLHGLSAPCESNHWMIDYLQ